MKNKRQNVFNALMVEIAWRWVPTALARLLPEKLPLTTPQAKTYYFSAHEWHW